MRPIRTFLLAAFACTALPVAAHHGFRMDYDASSTYWLEGTVIEGYYGQPHAEFTLRLKPGAAPGPGPIPENAKDLFAKLKPLPGELRSVVEVEFPQQQMFYELGDVLNAGDTVAVIVVRGCETPRPLRGQWVMLPDGTTIRARGTVQSEVAYCPRRTNRQK